MLTRNIIALLLSLWAAPALSQAVLGGANIPTQPQRPPADSIGNEANWYIDWTSGNIFGPKSSGQWPQLPIGTFTVNTNDARYFHLACDGVTNDTAAFSAMLAQLNLTNNPVTVTFPGVCVINAGAYAISAGVSFEGIGIGSGLKLSAGSTISTNLLTWSGTSPVACKNFTLDYNNAGISGNAVLTGFLVLNATSMTSNSCRFINGGTVASSTGGLLELYYATATGTATFKNDYFHFTAAQSYFNEGLQFKGSNVLVYGEISKNTGMASYGGGTNVIFSNNSIDGFGFGAGITFEPSGVSDIADKHSQIVNNVITNSATANDVNGTKLDGIEVGYYGVLISNNTTSNMCGAGITIYGKDTVIGNHVHNSGTCNNATFGAYYRSGIVSVVANGNSASGSFLSENTVDDDGGGNTTYGYSDIAAVTGVVMGVNNFQGSLGAYNIAGAAHFASAQIDNRIVNPCGQINQKNAAASVFSGIGPDQWTVVETFGNVSVGTTGSDVFGLGNCDAGMIATVTTQYTPVTTNLFTVYQNIGLADVQDFDYGSVYAKDMIFAFCANANTVPPYTGGWFVQNFNATYTYTGTYTISAAAHKRQCFSYKIPGDILHSLGVTETNAAFRVGFDLGSGPSEVTAPGAWTSGGFYGSTGVTPFVSKIVGSTITFSEVRLLPAGADNGWVPRSLAQELQNAQRFYRTSFPAGTQPAQNAGLDGAVCMENPIANGQPSVTVPFSPKMWGTPGIVTFNPSAANSSWRNVSASNDVAPFTPAGGISTNGLMLGTAATIASIGSLVCIHYVAASPL